MSTRPDRTLARDIVVAAELIRQRLDGVREPSFLVDDLLQDGVMMQILVIGESVSNLTLEFRREYPDVAWEEIRGMRNVLAHSYHRVSLQRIYYTATVDVPRLGRLMQTWLDQHPEPPQDESIGP